MVVYGCVDDHILEEVCPGGKVGLNGTEMYKEYVNTAVSDRQFVEAKSPVCTQDCFKNVDSIINRIIKKNEH